MSLLTLGPISAFAGPLASPSGALSAHSDDCWSLLSRSLSGGELLLGYANGPTAAAAAAAPPCASARVSRAMCAMDTHGHGRVDGGAPAAMAATGVAAAALTRVGAPAGWRPVAAVPADGGCRLLRASAVDFRASLRCCHTITASPNPLCAQPSRNA